MIGGSVIKILVVLLAITYNNEDKCLESIKTGHFKYEGELWDNVIVRTKSEQIEKFNNGNSIIISKVKWNNDKEYVITIKKMVNCPASEFTKKGSKIKVKIKECSETYYTCDVEYINGEVIHAKYIKL